VCVHGVALKPGKPLCLAVTAVDSRRVPIAVLPGFPTSALFTFHEFVAPLLRVLAGQHTAPQHTIAATLPHDLASERGRREYALVQLLAPPDVPQDMPPQAGPQGHVPSTTPIAMPIGKGSGSVTAFCRADGFIAVPRQTERLLAGATVEVQPIDRDTTAPDLVIVGSHCTGLERLVDHLHAQGSFKNIRLLAQGSQGGLAAAARGLCDIAPIHLLDPDTGIYNQAFVPDDCDLVPGYGRMQGLVSRPDDPRFADLASGDDFTLPACVREPDVFLVNRNRGSGTRNLLDALLGPGPRPAGYSHEARSHNGVAACVAQGRADWGIAISTVAADSSLRFCPIRAERYDFVIPRTRRARPAVQAFLRALADPHLRAELRAAGFLD
jgi:putative molybdopterin biosynthesis protein